MGSIFSALQQRKAVKQNSAKDRYVDLLNRLASTSKDPSEKDLDLIDALTQELGFSAAEVQQDIDEARRGLELKAQADQLPQRERAAKLAKEAFVESEQRTARIIADAQNKHLVFADAHRRAGHAEWEANHAIEELKKIAYALDMRLNPR